MKLFLNKSNKGKYKVAQRDLSFLKKNQVDCYEREFKVVKQSYCAPTPFWWKEGWTSNQISKNGGLTGPQLLEGVCWERGGDIIQEGRVQFSHKNKSKSEIFNGKKVYEQKHFSLS